MTKNKKNKNIKPFPPVAAIAPKPATTTTTYVPCHTGNTVVYKHPTSGGALYIGGWTKNATFNWNTHVIDLTGTEHKFWDIPFPYDDNSRKFMPFLAKSYAGWLSLPFPDYQVPSGMSTLEQWKGITQVINDILQTGTDVLVACQGGHGRSGLFCAIVGYLLSIDTDRSWASPVEKIRKIHCNSAVETFAQEKFVYDILGLNITIKHAYTDKYNSFKEYDDYDYGRFMGMPTYKNCPICNTQSTYVEKQGMCWTCIRKYEGEAPERDDLTLQDIKNKGEVEHSCKAEKCMGIWKASKCGHVTHDMIIYEGWCESCWTQHQEEIEWAENHVDDEEDNKNSNFAKCVICDVPTMYAQRFGICYECAEELGKTGHIDHVHNTITDPYHAYPHNCNDISCVGIVIADVCEHMVHNHEVVDGLCPECWIVKNKRGEQE